MRRRTAYKRRCNRVSAIDCELAGASREAELYVSLFDEQLCVAWNGELLLCHPYQRPATAGRAPSEPFRVAAAGPEHEIRQLRIERDVYYTPLVGQGPTVALDSPLRLGNDEFFVLGDNSPQSRDSRLSEFGPGVPASLLVGRPLLVYFPGANCAVWRADFSSSGVGENPLYSLMKQRTIASHRARFSR